MRHRDSQYSPSTSGEVDERELLLMRDAPKCFHEDVGAVIFGTAVSDANSVVEDAFTNEVEANIDVF